MAAICCSSGGFLRGSKITVTSKGKSFPINILDYLAYGHYEYRRGEGNAYLHTHLPVNREFRITVSTPENEKDKIVVCINGFLAFGGIGSRTRNGFGSLGVKSDGINGIAIRDFTKLSPAEYPTLNKKSKLYVTRTSYPTWEEALSEIGIVYKNVRTSLERQHFFNRRGLIARSIEVKGEDIPQHIRNGRHPKQFFLHEEDAVSIAAFPNKLVFICPHEGAADFCKRVEETINAEWKKQAGFARDFFGG